MKILVTGARGMLGQDLVPILRGRGHEVVGLGHAELDITDGAAVRRVLEAEVPEVIIQSAAFTNVDGCESQRDEAFRVNAFGTRVLAIGCQYLQAPLLYVSTDYVFDGTSKRPYLEADHTNPQSVYGQSKAAGERAVTELLNRFFIVRTSWLYGRHGKNFVDTMRKLGREKPELAVVADQIGSPTWTVPLSQALGELIERGLYGTYHLTGQGETSWHGFTEAILAAEGLTTPVRAITTAELGRPAPRPAYAVLENMNARLAGLAPLPPWQESLRAYVESTRS